VGSEGSLTNEGKRTARASRCVDALVFVRPDRTIGEWGVPARKMYRWLRREAVGQPVAFLFEDDSSTSLTELFAAAGAGNPAVGTTLAVRKDGSHFYAELTVAALPSSSPSRGFVLFVRNVTDAVLAEAAAAAIAASADPVAALESFREVLGRLFPIAQLTFSVVARKDIRSVASAGSLTTIGHGDGAVELFSDAVARAAASRRPVVVADIGRSRFESDAPLGEAGIGSYVVLPLRRADDVLAVLGAGFTAPDVPTREVVRVFESVVAFATPLLANVLIFERQAKTIRVLEQLDDVKNEFLEVTAHDIQTPLSVIGGHGELLQRRWNELAESERLEHLDAIVRNSKSLMRIAERALQAARLESGSLPKRAVPLDIGAHVRWMIGELGTFAETERIRLLVSDDLPLVSIDPDAHWHIFSNLLGNATKFSAPETAIDVEVSTAHDTVEVSVRDRGVGIPREALPKLFERFARIGTPHELAAYGNGLGLFICKTLLDANGGRISVVSAPGWGSRFTYTLPVASTVVRAASAVDKQPVAVGERNSLGTAVHSEL
jgi:PAS domain S-box-containing protein